MADRKKVVIIGLDGATFDIIEPMIQRGELKTIAGLLRNGVCGRLGSTYPPLTPPAWTTFSTGKNPAKHGVFDFVTPPYGNSETFFSNFNSIKCPTFWELLNGTDFRFAVMNLPLTYPPSQLNGFMISGMDTPNDQVTFTYPADLLTDLYSIGLNYQSKYFTKEHGSAQSERSMIETFFRVEKQRQNVFRYLLENRKWDVAVCVSMLLDKVQHFFWHLYGDDIIRDNKSPLPKGFNPIAEAYRLADRFIDEMVSLLDRDTHIILVSDHGFGKVEGIFFINAWLKQKGYLRFKQTDVKNLVKSIDFIKKRKTGAEILTKLKLNFVNKFLPTNLLSHRMSFYLPRLIPTHNTVDWSNTNAFGAAYGIYVNLKGRSAYGAVNPGSEYEDIREKIQFDLEKLENPRTGKKLGLKLYKKEEIMCGPFLDSAPDLIFNFESCDILPNHSYNFKRILSFPSNFGTHRYHGIFALSGPGIKKGETLQGVRIEDIMPTIFYILNQPISEEFDGRVLIDAFSSTHPTLHPVNYQPEIAIDLKRGIDSDTYTSEQAKQVSEKLRALGYI